MAPVLEHPLVWSAQERFRFLWAVGKEEEVVSNKQSARAALPPRLLVGAKWHESMDDAVYKHYTSGDYSREYDTSSTTHLLRFLRNCKVHPPPQDSMAQSVLVAHGGMARYFVGECFPQLAMAVRGALLNARWFDRSNLAPWLYTGAGAEAGAGAGAGAGLVQGLRLWG
jgi:hypothetical protein